MAVIITNRELPYSCINCWNKADCDYYDRYLRDPHFKHPNCPLKSTDEMIAEIEDTYINNCDYSYQTAVDIIHKFTDKEQESD